MILRRRSCYNKLERGSLFIHIGFKTCHQDHQGHHWECPSPPPSYTWAPALKSSCLCLTRWSTSPHTSPYKSHKSTQVSQVHTTVCLTRCSTSPHLPIVTLAGHILLGNKEQRPQSFHKYGGTTITPLIHDILCLFLCFAHGHHCIGPHYHSVGTVLRLQRQLFPNFQETAVWAKFAIF